MKNEIIQYEVIATITKNCIKNKFVLATSTKKTNYCN